jgi:hypothetical protein
MRDIYSNDSFKITEDNNINKISFAYSNISLINSLVKTKLIIGATITHDYKTILFNSFSLKSFSQFQKERKQLGYRDALNMIHSLSLQLNYLINIILICIV